MTVNRRAPRELGYRGQQVLQYVRTAISEEGQAPSYRMICDQLGIATKGEVSQIVAALERRALIARVGSGRVRRKRRSA